MPPKISESHESWKSSINPGLYLFHVKGETRLTEISVNRYRLSVEGGLDKSQDPQAFTQSAAYWLDKMHGTPVAGSGDMHVISPTKLTRSVNAKDHKVTPEKVGEVTLHPGSKAERAKIKELVESALRRAIPDSQYSFRFLNEIIRNEIEFGGEDYDFGAQRKYSLKVHVTTDGVVLLQIGVGYNLTTIRSLDKMVSAGEELPSWRVEHDMEVYGNSGGGQLLGWSELNYNDWSNALGETVSEYQEGIIDEDVRQELIEENPRLVEINYGNFTGDQAPRALKVSPRTEQVEDQDREFHDRFTSRRAMEPNERFELIHEFISDLPPLPGFDLSFGSSPSNYGFDFQDFRDGQTQLVYSDGNYANKPSKGLSQHGVYESPGKYRVGVLYPPNFEDITEELAPLLVRHLADWGAPAGTATQKYELGQIDEYTDVYRDLHEETDVVVALVPNKGAAEQFAGVEDPHYELKRTLMRKGIPTQMMQKSTAEDIIRTSQKTPSDSLANILSAVVAKAGGTPWQVENMPGRTQAFMGLDVTRDQESGQHSGASASIVMRDGSSFAAESTTQQAGEKFVSDQVEQFVRDLVFDFADENNEPLDRLTIFRDGKVNEDTDAIRDGLNSLDAEVDIVSIRKRGQTRIAKFDGTRFRIAPKGVGFVDTEREQAIIHSFGKPEFNDDNNVGTPRTLRLVKDSGPTDITILAEQAYWLSEVHYGSPVRSTRLPVPIKYADMAAKYVSDGYVDPGSIIRGPAYL